MPRFLRYLFGVWLFVGIAAFAIPSQPQQAKDSPQTSTSTSTATTANSANDAANKESPECDSVAARWSDEQFNIVADSWKFSSDDRAKLKQLGRNLVDINHWKNDPFEVARFLVDCKMDLKQSETMFRNLVQWRLDTNADTFMERYKEFPPEVYHIPMYLLKDLDKEGDPIMIQRFGKMDGWGLYQRLGAEETIKANLFFNELITSRDVGVPERYNWQQGYYEPLTGRRFTHFTVIVDLEGLNTRNLKPALLNVLKQSAQIGQDYYPGLLKRAIVIRAPKIFQWAWSLCQHFYDAKAREKIVFVTNKDNFLDVLNDYMDLEVLPSVIDPIHGKGQPMHGFEQVNMEGGLLPPPVGEH